MVNYVADFTTKDSEVKVSVYFQNICKCWYNTLILVNSADQRENFVNSVNDTATNVNSFSVLQASNHREVVSSCARRCGVKF